MFDKSFSRRSRLFIRWAGLALGGVLLLQLLTVLLAEGFWFQQVGYSRIFFTRLLTQGSLGLLVFAISWMILQSNLRLAERQAWTQPAVETERPKWSGWMNWPRLLPLVLLISLGVAVILVVLVPLTVGVWNTQFNLQPRPGLLIGLSAGEWLNFFQNAYPYQSWQPFAAVGLTGLLLIFPRFWLSLIALATSIGFAVLVAGQWDRVLLALHPQAFNQADPLFQRDISFYLFSLPVRELLALWLLELAILSFLLVSLRYLTSADSLSQGYFPGFSPPQSRHLCGLAAWMMGMISLAYWINRYTLLYSSTGVSYGASYTSATVALPVYTALSWLAVPISGWLFWLALGRRSRLVGSGSPSQNDPMPDRWTGEDWDDGSASDPSVRTAQRMQRPQVTQRPDPLPSAALKRVIGLYVLAVLGLTLVLPLVVQRFVVQPNELALETPFIQRTIALTRQAFKLDDIEVETFDPNFDLTLEALRQNDLTVKNIRLWDKRPLLETNRQLERIRLYYEFPDADIDRYPLPTEEGQTIQQQVLIAARELDYTAVPTAAQTWINQHLIYTHGYGFTVSPVNTAGEGGLPDYFVRGIESTVDPRVQQSIPIGKPRIYFGELTDTYVMTQTQMQELDYPSGSDNVYNVYNGWDGVHIGNFAQRLLFANYLRDWRMMFTDNFTPQTKLLFRRNIADRVKTIAPFLQYDSNPYLVVADTNGKQWQHGAQPQQTPDESYLYWIIDAYTTSNRYPYADPLGNDFNYIRNSVKVVVDAYHGTVTFYVADAQDPIIQSWSRIFPDLFQPLTAMPPVLQRHLRYPEDFFQVQSNQLMTYHMTDPTVFYNREDQWRAANEIYGGEQQVVDPYYLIMKLPIGTAEEFILLRPFTPAQRTNLIAWLASRSDREEYGKSLLYVFPKQKQIFGPEQIEARINQDPVISERISLWNRQGSRAVQGNLLVIPIEQSLLYVEPLYLVAEQNQLPTLVRVIVAYENRIAMAETLEAALDAIFGGAATSANATEPPILRTTDAVEAIP